MDSGRPDLELELARADTGPSRSHAGTRSGGVFERRFDHAVADEIDPGCQLDRFAVGAQVARRVLPASALRRARVAGRGQVVA